MRTSIKAHDDRILTNGEIYGSEIYLADGLKAEDFHEITRAEYDALIADQSIISQEV